MVMMVAGIAVTKKIHILSETSQALLSSSKLKKVVLKIA